MLARTPNDELDAGPRKGGPGTERLCALTRTVKPVDELIRFVVGPDGVVPDLKRKLPGRGLWITGEKSALKDAVTHNVFARGFKREPGILDGIEISREDAEAMIMQARLKAGWITEADLAQPAAEAEPAETEATPA